MGSNIWLQFYAFVEKLVYQLLQGVTALLKLSPDAADKKIKIGQAPILAPVFFREAM